MNLFMFSLSFFILWPQNKELHLINSSAKEPIIWENKIYKEGIKTVLTYKKGWELSMPIIDLHSGDKISLVFDELGSNAGKYSWTIVHCNSNWQQSDAVPLDFMSGINYGTIDQYESSQNTMTDYINYQFDFPNDECELLISGNYIIKVYENDNPDEIVLVSRFYVAEKLLEISANIEQLKVNRLEGMNQRVNFSLNYPNEIENPIETVSYKIIKNNETEKDFIKLKPSSISGNIIRYENIDFLAFAGGNECRHFDLKSFKFLSDHLQKIEKKSDNYHVKLNSDNDRLEEEYRFENDINGRSLIKLENNEKSNIMADYCTVYFELQAPFPLETGDYYIFGSLSNWSLNESFKMEYNYKSGYFEKKLLLKQGYYNYLYRFSTSDLLLNTEPNKYKVEGNHFQTENDYYIFAYYKAISQNYDRLIGYCNINSIKHSGY